MWFDWRDWNKKWSTQEFELRTVEASSWIFPRLAWFEQRSYHSSHFRNQLLQDHIIRFHYYPKIPIDAFQVLWNPSVKSSIAPPVVRSCKYPASRSSKCRVLSSANVAYWLRIYSVRSLLLLFHSSKFRGRPPPWPASPGIVRSLPAE
jgi:hypothetical protein